MGTLCSSDLSGGLNAASEFSMEAVGLLQNSGPLCLPADGSVLGNLSGIPEESLRL